MAIDELTYPQPVADRTGPAAGGGVTAGAAVAPPPRTRVIWFESSAAANSRNTSASAKIRGPAIIKDIAYGKSGATDSATQALELGKASTAINEGSVPRTTPKPYTTLMEGPATPMAVMVPPYNGLPIMSSEAPLAFGASPLNIIVMDAEFHLIFAAYNASAGAVSYRGFVTVLEDVSPAALANFL